MSERTDDLSRRELLRTVGASITLATAGVQVVSAQGAQHVHQAVADEKSTGPYKPKCFTAHQYDTLRKLADYIIPPDGNSKGALDAGAPEFIDFLCSRNDELAAIYTGGMAWLDHEMIRRYAADFFTAKPEQQSAVLDLIAYRKNESPELGPGIHFFNWARNMTVDAYYTSKAGMDELGYMGNTVRTEFSVPVEAIEYAIKRSGL
jgi:gluconate 2-dehydrogenase gamma chain